MRKAHAERVPVFCADELSLFDPAKRAALEIECEGYYRSTAFHEAGHVIAAVATGRACEYVTIGGGYPHCCYSLAEHELGEPTLAAFMVRSTAGCVAEGIAERFIRCPDRSLMQAFLVKARRGQACGCDRCKEAAVLVAMLPGLDDAELVAHWRAWFQHCLALFDTGEFRNHLHRVARALSEHTLLRRADLAALIDAEALQAARSMIP